MVHTVTLNNDFKHVCSGIKTCSFYSFYGLNRTSAPINVTPCPIVGSYCSICNEGGSLFICDASQCGRPYCPACIARVCGPGALEQVEKSDPWFCVLCNESGKLGELCRRKDWQVMELSTHTVHLYGV